MQIEKLRESVGQEVGVSDWRTITQAMIDTFADLTDDHLWIHVDPERARRDTPFGSTIAHGFLTVGLLTPMVRDAVDLYAGGGMRLNYGFNRLRFPSPVRSGARVRARVAANSLRDFEGGVDVTWGVTVEIENEPKPALVAEWIVRIYT